MPELLRIRKISKHFDGTQALRHVDLSLATGEVHALVGENGAGKSTLAKIIGGVIAPDAGDLVWDGAPVVFSSPVHAQRLGIGIIFQELDLFPHLTVAENIVIGNVNAERGPFVDSRGAAHFCEPLLREVGLDRNPRSLVADLSIGEMQLVAIARALAMNARLIVMDEPTSSLAESSAETLFGLIGQLKQKGVSILYVSHKMDEIFRLADRISVLRDGALVSTKAAGATGIAEVISAMVGRELSDTRRAASSQSREVVLSVRGLMSRKLAGISFDLHAGEVLGVAGLVGAGRSSLGAALFGLDRTVRGSIQVHGKPFAERSPRAAIRCGIGLLPEDRKTQGLMAQMTVKENATVSILERLQRFGLIRVGDETRLAGEMHDTLLLKAASQDAAVSTLSGGNQQKVLLARWLLVNPDIFFLDDPTRGIDIGAKHDIYGVIDRLAHAGKGIILISSELPELLRCSDRIMVLHEGRNMGILDAASATQERIMALATRAAGQVTPEET